MNATGPHSPETIASLAAKMDAWAGTLTREEQRTLRDALIGPSDDDVTGFTADVWGAGVAMFSLQQLLSRYNQAQSLTSNVVKTQSDTNNSIISKIR